MGQMRIFVSHSSQDNAFCDALVHGLRGAGANVWYDQQNLGVGQLLDVITKELRERKVFIVILSKAAFASQWVRQECKWVFNLSVREPERLILPVVAQPVERADFDEMLYLEDFRRIEGPSNQPYPEAEAITQTLALLSLTPASTAATSVPPESTSTKELIARGKALIAQERYADAVPLFERATEQSSRNYNAWFNLGYALGNVERIEEALAAFDRAIALRPNASVCWYNKGLALNILERYQEALEALEQSLTLDSDYPEAWCEKCTALGGLDRPPDR